MNKGFTGRTKHCIECGIELPAQRASYELRNRAYCDQCKELAHVKERWQPMASGFSVSSIFVLKEPPNRQTPKTIEPEKPDPADKLK